LLWLLSSVCVQAVPAEPRRAQIVGSDESVVLVAAAPTRQSAPAATDDSAETDESRVVDVAVVANDRDPDGDALRVVSVTQGANGSVLINGDDTLRYQPDTGFTGLDRFTYTIDDGHGGTDAATVNVRVNDVADTPVAENQTLQTDEDTPLVITLRASDADDDPLTFTIERPPARGSLTGTPPDLSYTPEADYYGKDRFVFAADDGHGGSDSGTVSITIRSVCDVPVAADDSATTDEGRVVDIPVLANDRDPDGEALRVVDVTRGANGWVLINGDDTLRYQPDGGFTGRDGFAYTIDDGHGGTDTATVSVTVRPVP
jgi:N-acetylmuramoyl-L-alanine amidase